MLIKMVSGTYGLRINGIVKGMTPDDDPFELEDNRARQLIATKNAIEVISHENDIAKAESDTEDIEVEEQDSSDTAEVESGTEELSSYTMDELKTIAKDIGVQIPRNVKKSDLINLIKEADQDEGEEPPILEAADPEE
ncbi:MAG: Rho termination factor N-terminal domain-containing protein [bacterium]|nr:Rho termination factor N-terminal domain-containing protein [bacterium]